MKKLLVLFAMAAMMFPATGAVAVTRVRNVNGSGVIVSRDIDLAAFTSVSAHRSVKVVLVERNEGPARVEADDNVIDMLDIKVVDGELVADFDRDLGSLTINRCNVTVTVPLLGPISALSADSAAKIICRTVVVADNIDIRASSAARIEAPIRAVNCDINASSAADVRVAVNAFTCDVEASSAAEVDADLKCNESRVTASSSAEITLIGRSDSLTAHASSAAEIDASDLQTAYCKVNTSSGADAEVNCSGKLEAEASSGSTISYEGDCSWRTDERSGGSIHRRD